MFTAVIIWRTLKHSKKAKNDFFAYIQVSPWVEGFFIKKTPPPLYFPLTCLKNIASRRLSSEPCFCVIATNMPLFHRCVLFKFADLIQCCNEDQKWTEDEESLCSEKRPKTKTKIRWNFEKSLKTFEDRNFFEDIRRI